jgi:serine/threonine protein kinase
VAVKVVHPEIARDPEFIQRFRREVAAAQAVSDAYTAAVVGAGPDDSPPWLATTFVPGPSLADLVVQAGPLPEDAVWRLAGGLAEALQAIHAQGLVHRDLKPGNILIAADGPRVIDFGISRTTSGTVVTATQMTIGTPAYMSPEQAQGHTVSPASDIFSLGSVLAFAATGQSPFGGGEMFAIGLRVVHGKPDLTRVPESLRPVIDACLKKDPADRPALGQLMHTVAASAVAYPEVTPGRFWPDRVSTLLESATFKPVLPPPTLVPPPSSTTEAAVPVRYAPPLADPVARTQAANPVARPSTPGPVVRASGSGPVPRSQAANPVTGPSAAGPVVHRRVPRWLLPVVLGLAVAIAAGIAITLAISPSPKPPTFLPGETSSPSATAAGGPAAVVVGPGTIPATVRTVR